MARTDFMHRCEDHDASDAALLDMLTGPVPPKIAMAKAKSSLPRRDEALDPLLLAAAAASGPHVTRNHYHHDFFPGVMDPRAEGAWDWTKWRGEDASNKRDHKRLTYVSRQAPRRQRLQPDIVDSKENAVGRDIGDPLKRADNLPPSTRKRRSSVNTAVHVDAQPTTITSPSDSLGNPSPAVEVKCMARTRIPTTHGPAFLHLYHNNRDSKEHLAIVIDSAQFANTTTVAPPIRSRTLDAIWSDNETEMDRITRGAYVGRLSPTVHTASKPTSHHLPSTTDAVPSPLIRIHSECFTGETIGSMRCDCGEQLDEAIRQISQPIVLPSTDATIPGRGAVIYLRQEGRGIGLLSKIRAYNLQDLGHDTVTANLMLGHGADERGYEIAGAILRDLGLGSEQGEAVRVLTNNPDKVRALEEEGLRVVERVPMIPRSWQARHPAEGAPTIKKAEERDMGAALIGGGAVHGVDLDKYLRTKVLRMGHILPLWMEDPPAE
ncbi:hypothetical protein PLICRDRAFT_33796 [Plicaturopsis crispa FD-325 SS-3]|nr:hypothetical protein PLICRDRAFT_33796 [Plicaturopsis crispa FD-325 SS-3]